MTGSQTLLSCYIATSSTCSRSRLDGTDTRKQQESNFYSPGAWSADILQLSIMATLSASWLNSIAVSIFISSIYLKDDNSIKLLQILIISLKHVRTCTGRSIQLRSTCSCIAHHHCRSLATQLPSQLGAQLLHSHTRSAKLLLDNAFYHSVSR